MKRQAIFTLSGILLASITAFAAGGGLLKGKVNNQEQTGPLGFPALKKLAELLQLTHDQEQQVLRIYNEYQKKEHELQQENSKKDAPGGKPATADSKSLHGDMVNEIKAVLTEEQRKKLDELLSDSGKKKKKT
jgi:Spy/CpxP family protein refolding chaperone